jgi:hypothetical protein
MNPELERKVESIIERLTTEFDTNNLWKSENGDTAYLAIGNLWEALRKEMKPALQEAYELGRKEERERVEQVFKDEVPPHGLSLEDSVWLKRILNKAFH